MAAPPPLGVACLGLGRLGLVHAQNVAGRVPGAVLRVVCDTDPAWAKEAPRAFPGVRFTADPLDAIASTGVDAVVIATTTQSHAALVRAACAMGRQVFCEKPLALAVEEAAQAAAGADAAGVLLYVGFMRRVDEGYRRAHAMIAQGAIGRPLLFHSHSLDRGVSESPRFLATCGGLLVDVGLHDFDLAEWLMARPVVEVAAQGEIVVHRQLAAYRDVDNAVVTLRFEGGGMGVVVLSHTAAYGYDVATTVTGDAGAVRAGGLAVADAWRMDAAGGIEQRAYGDFVERFGSAYLAEMWRFVDLARARRDGRAVAAAHPGGREGVRALEIALAARRSLASGRPEAVAPGSEADARAGGGA